jgi:hypothetical protein
MMWRSPKMPSADRLSGADNPEIFCSKGSKIILYKVLLRSGMECSRVEVRNEDKATDRSGGVSLYESAI